MMTDVVESNGSLTRPEVGRLLWTTVTPLRGDQVSSQNKPMAEPVADRELTGTKSAQPRQG